MGSWNSPLRRSSVKCLLGGALTGRAGLPCSEGRGVPGGCQFVLQGTQRKASPGFTESLFQLVFSLLTSAQRAVLISEKHGTSFPGTVPTYLQLAPDPAHWSHVTTGSFLPPVQLTSFRTKPQQAWLLPRLLPPFTVHITFVSSVVLKQHHSCHCPHLPSQSCAVLGSAASLRA